MLEHLAIVGMVAESAKFIMPSHVQSILTHLPDVRHTHLIRGIGLGECTRHGGLHRSSRQHDLKEVSKR